MRANYLRAIAWLAVNEDPAWLDKPDDVLPPAAQLVVALWDRPAWLVVEHVRTARAKMLGDAA